MSIKIKLLVEFNNEKYSVFVESDNKLIKFETVSNEIIKQLKQNISLKTHSFEIFDKDFEEYVLITNANLLTDISNYNLSRIRIKPKATDRELSAEKLSLSDSYSLEQKCMSTLDQSFGENHPIVDNWFAKHFLVQKPIESPEERSEKSGKTDLFQESDDKRYPERSVAKFRPKAINYMQLPNKRFSPQVFYYTIMINFGGKQLIGLRYHSDVFKGVKLVLEIMIRIKSIKHQSFDNQWKSISYELVANGFEQWSPETSRKQFFRAFNLYKKSLDMCPNFEIASEVNPLFEAFHSFDPKLIITSREYKEVTDLRQIFDKRSERTNSWMKVTTQKNTIDPRKQLDSPKIRKLSNLSEDNIIMFKTLANCVQTVAKEFGPVSIVSDFWELVTKQMKTNGFKTFSVSYCMTLFREYVNDYYGMVLYHSPDYRTAAKVYPLFEFIDSMDLSLCLSHYSYQKIKCLRKKFNKTVL